jgi:glycosyltransferase involved in cell wall biosynthesis
MRIVLVADTFPPLRTSGAVQLRDLSREFVRQGHALTVLLPAANLHTAYSIENIDGIEVIRLRAPKTKDINYVSRTINEFLMPFMMRRNLRNSPIADKRWDGVVWYSPSIFFGPLAKSLKTMSRCNAYLIIRDIFPEWAVDLGLMGNGLPYHFFRAIARYQYSVADVIGVQTSGNLSYFAQQERSAKRRTEVLENWLADAPVENCSIKLAETPLAGRKILVYAGNMGVAQGLDVLLDLAERLINRTDLGFLFVGRGGEAKKMSSEAAKRGLSNVVFHDEIHPDEIPALYAQCAIGIVALDRRHRSHNIPGKFLTYMQSGLPVLANINANNDLATLIHEEDVGRACADGEVETLVQMTHALVMQLDQDAEIKSRCRLLYQKRYKPAVAVSQIVAALAQAR